MTYGRERYGAEFYCSVVQPDPTKAKYEVKPAHQYLGERGLSGLTVTGKADQVASVADFVAQVSSVTSWLEQAVAKNRGWQPPKLETVAEKIRELRCVAGVSVHR